MRCSGGALHISARGDGNRIEGRKFASAIDPPGAEHNDADPVRRVQMRCTEPSRIPSHQDQIWTRFVEIAVERGHFTTVRRQVAPRLERYFVVRQDKGFARIGRMPAVPGRVTDNVAMYVLIAAG